MNRDETIKAIKVMEAYVDGKEVEAQRPIAGSCWIPASEPRWDWFNCIYRIKPTPVLRPWTADEVPLGAWMRFKKVIDDRSILAWTSTQRDRDIWLSEREHSIDGGKNWLPCGVVEEAK